MSSFFKKFQEKANILGKVAKEYYDEGMAYATHEMEKEEKMKESNDKQGNQFLHF
jgi:hypothetical protein